ncbi:SDR family oxidoreductase [Pseudomonas borbori]
MTMQSLHGALVVITGASSGIGRATAHAYARHGVKLVLAARDAQALEAVVGECQQHGASALAVPTDMTDNQAVGRLLDAAAEFGDGHIAVWINNAGVGAVGAFDKTPLSAHEQVIQTDLLGYIRGAHGVLPYFKAQGCGVLINTLSVGSWVAQPFASAYSAAKYGLRGFTETLRGELTEWPNIHVCDVYPAVIDTPGFRDGGNYTGRALTPPPPLYDPRKVADAMVRLALQPKPTTTVGASASVMRVSHFLLPRFDWLSGKLTSAALRRADPSASSSGNLFAPASGERRIDGGWRKPQRAGALVAAGVAAAVLIGVGVAYARHSTARISATH